MGRRFSRTTTFFGLPSLHPAPSRCLCYRVRTPAPPHQHTYLFTTCFAAPLHSQTALVSARLRCSHIAWFCGARQSLHRDSTGSRAWYCKRRIAQCAVMARHARANHGRAALAGRFALRVRTVDAQCACGAAPAPSACTARSRRTSLRGPVLRSHEQARANIFCCTAIAPTVTFSRVRDGAGWGISVMASADDGIFAGTVNKEKRTRCGHGMRGCSGRLSLHELVVRNGAYRADGSAPALSLGEERQALCCSLSWFSFLSCEAREGESVEGMREGGIPSPLWACTRFILGICRYCVIYGEISGPVTGCCGTSRRERKEERRGGERKDIIQRGMLFNAAGVAGGANGGGGGKRER